MTWHFYWHFSFYAAAPQTHVVRNLVFQKAIVFWGLTVLRDFVAHQKGVGKRETVQRERCVALHLIRIFRVAWKRVSRKNVVITIASTSGRCGIFSSPFGTGISVWFHQRMAHFVHFPEHHHCPLAVWLWIGTRSFFLGRKTVLKKILAQDFFYARVCLLSKRCCIANNLSALDPFGGPRGKARWNSSQSRPTREPRLYRWTPSPPKFSEKTLPTPFMPRKIVLPRKNSPNHWSAEMSHSPLSAFQSVSM